MSTFSIKTSRFDVMQAPIHALTMQDLNDIVVDAATVGRRTIIAHQNLHGLYLFHKHKRLRDFYREADYVHVDGMAIVGLARLLGLPLQKQHRTTYVDWIRPLIKVCCEHDLRVFFLGSRPGVDRVAKDQLTKEFPGLQMEVAHGYFCADPGSDENEAVIQRINAYRPHVLLVGMGMPRQEYWICENSHRLDTTVVLPCGACMEYVAGVVSTPPRWLGRMGLEWAYRLLGDPSRFWRRYLVEPWFLALLFVRHWTGQTGASLRRKVCASLNRPNTKGQSDQR